MTTDPPSAPGNPNAHVTMRLGSAIKPDKGDLWAQALTPNLLSGEHVRLLVKGRLSNLTDDLIAVTDLRVLAAQTTQHCRVREELALAEISGAEPGRTRLGGHGVTLSTPSGESRRISLSAMRGAGDDEPLVAGTIQDLLRAEISPELAAARLDDEALRSDELQRLTDARQGLWPGTIVVGSRPRSKAAETVIAHCGPRESPWLIIGSLGAGVLAAFEDRLILVKTGAITAIGAGSFGGARVTSFAFDHITGIEYNSGMLNGVLEVLTPSYSGSANKDFWRGTGRSPNSDSNSPFALSNTLPLSKSEHAQALPHLNELRRRIADSKRVNVTFTQEPAAPGSGLVAELEKLANLRDAGVLDDEEFRAAKQRLLNS